MKMALIRCRSSDDAQVTSMILAIGLVLKPLVAACFVMTIYVLANYLGMALVSDEAVWARKP